MAAVVAITVEVEEVARIKEVAAAATVEVVAITVEVEEVARIKEVAAAAAMEQQQGEATLLEVVVVPVILHHLPHQQQKTHHQQHQHNNKPVQMVQHLMLMVSVLLQHLQQNKMATY